MAKGAFESEGVVLGGARELSEGWFFPCVTKGVGIFAGVIVHKATCPMAAPPLAIQTIAMRASQTNALPPTLA